MLSRLIIAALVIGCLTAPAFAQGHGNGNGNGNAGGNGNGKSNGADIGNGGGNGRGANNSSDGSHPGGGHGNNAGGRTPPVEVPVDPGVIGEASQSAPETAERTALDAVQSGKAVPLETLSDDVRDRTGGDIIDAELLTVEGFLIYGIKVLTPAGQVSTEYYYARSGRHVDVR